MPHSNTFVNIPQRKDVPASMKIPNGLPVTDLQRALREISRAESSVRPVVPDGVFGSETTQAVQQFQRSYGLNPSG